MGKLDPAIVAHLEWIGFVRPTGLVVSAPALVRAGAILDRNDITGQRLLASCVEERIVHASEGRVPCLVDFRTFAERVLDWSFSSKGYAGTEECPIPVELEVPLPDYGETLRPDFAVRELDPKDGASPWQLVVRVLDSAVDFDRFVRGSDKLEASEHSRMERLLRQTGVPAGLLFNGRALRLLSAPRGESSGWLDFRVADMIQTAGRPISTALRLLLIQSRLLALPRPQRFGALLEDSRRFQNEVSERLSEQVLHGLYELQRGFQAAHDATNGELLRQPLADQPDEVYRALLTVILRIVFLLYAEERDILPEDEAFLRHYSLAGLFERLREDAAVFPDTMDQRFGAWAQLLVLFRAVNDGARLGDSRLPARRGVLFDPDRFPFLEGRTTGVVRQIDERLEAPLVPDGTIYRLLEKLLVLDGERISYRALDVEQIGSVYETMMGFRLETATGRSVAIKAQKKHGAPTTVDLDELLGQASSKREKWLKDRTDRKLTDKLKLAVRQSSNLEAIHAALIPVIDIAATPDLVPRGAMVLQPSEERRRSGSHYTPRSLTEPIVRTTLEPILERLSGDDGRPPRPEAILDLKVCDPAMGSGAFLVEACRQLGDALVESWRANDAVPDIPADEDEVVFARRLVAQRCLYGVDKNPVAVDLAKVSLWLVTLAKDHALTFLDHALRHGDSLAGLSQKQIEVFNWDGRVDWESPFRAQMRQQLRVIAELRERIRRADESVSDWELRNTWDEVQFELAKVRLVGDLALAAYFEGVNRPTRESKRLEYSSAVVNGESGRYSGWLQGRRNADNPFVPFHWEIEFPEVFDRPVPGFDSVVGNPPFLGGKRISGALSKVYGQWLVQSNAGTNGNVDLVAHFFRRTYSLLRHHGTFGLLATNTIAQGDTREGGLRVIRKEGGSIFSARRRIVWPGRAAVVVTSVHVHKGEWRGQATLDKRRVARITAFLFYEGTDDMPPVLATNVGLSFIGCDIKGHGFLFADRDSRAHALERRCELIAGDRSNAEVIKEYVGGEELNEIVNDNDVMRYVIDFYEMSLDEAKRYPDVLKLVEERVRPERLRKAKDLAKWPWWQFWRPRREMRLATSGREWILANCQVGPHVSFRRQSSERIFAHTVNVFAIDRNAGFGILQSRVHETWARFFGSSMRDDIRYTPSDCFETFPFPEHWETDAGLETAGREYYQVRARHMEHNGQGVTKTYNRFHDPNDRDQSIGRLRELHTALDRAVLNAYGWSDLPVGCEFILDYETEDQEGRKRRKPWRYRWPDDVKDMVLARLLELNASRFREETRSGNAMTTKLLGTTRKRRVAKKPTAGRLFE